MNAMDLFCEYGIALMRGVLIISAPAICLYLIVTELIAFFRNRR